MPNHKISQPEFNTLLERMTVWYRLRRASLGLQKGILWGLTLAFVLSILAITTGLGLRFGLGRAELVGLLILGALFGGFSTGLALIIWPAPTIKVARFFDQYFRLNDRTSTAVEILEASRTVPSHKNKIHVLQVQDALAHGNQVSPRRNFFISFSWQSLLFSAFLTAGIILAALIGDPYFQQVSQRQAVRQSIQEQIVALEELRQVIRSNEDLTSEDQAEIDQIIEESIGDLEQSETAEQAVAVLTQAEEALQALEDPQVEDQVQTLQELGDLMLSGEDPADSLQEAGKNLVEGDLSASAQSLRNADLDNLTPEELASLADQLADAANSTAESNPGLSESLSQASQALQEGDLQSAQEALDEAADEIAQTAGQQALNNAAQQAAGQAGQSARQIIQSGVNQQTAQEIGGAGAQPGASGQTGGGNTGGQNTPGQDGSSATSGVGKGSSDQGSVTGPEAGQDPIDQGNGPGDGGERSFEPLADPQRLGGTGSMDVYLPPSGAEGEDVLGLENISPGEESTTTVPYTQVFPIYSETYRRALESGSIPPSLRSLVRDYFSNLEP